MAKSKKGSKKKKHINIDVSYDDDKDSICSDKKDIRWHKHIACKAEKGGCGGFFYFLGFIGAAIYYLSTATGFWNGVLGFLKAIIWPVFLVYGLLKQLGI